jgi:hypothetical protein
LGRAMPARHGLLVLRAAHIGPNGTALSWHSKTVP